MRVARLVVCFFMVLLWGAVAPHTGATPRFALEARSEIKLAQATDQRPRGREFVGVPRLEPRPGWVSIGSKPIAHSSGEGRMTVTGDNLKRVHLVAEGNSVLIRAVHVRSRGLARLLVHQEHDLQTGSSLDIDLPSRRGATTIEIEYRARTEGLRAPARLIVYRSP